MMNRHILTLLILSVLACCSCSRKKDEVYIPKDLDDAHAQLLTNTSPEELERIKLMKSEDDMIQYHFGAGMGLRNSWGLWSGSRLAKYFNNLGIHHPDDMSAIIMDTLWCRVHEQPLRLKERVTYYKTYWGVRTPPSPDTKTPDGRKIQFRRMLTSTNELPRVIYLGVVEKDNAVWGYEWDRGVYQVSRGKVDSFMQSTSSVHTVQNNVLEDIGSTAPNPQH